MYIYLSVRNDNNSDHTHSVRHHWWLILKTVADYSLEQVVDAQVAAKEIVLVETVDHLQDWAVEREIEVEDVVDYHQD